MTQSQSSMNQPQPGDILAGKYRIEKVLGAGGMGCVVAAQDLQLERKVAIKFLLPEVLSNSEAVARFMREAQAAVRIQSEHVARVIDVGKFESGAPFMVMEYLDGGDLSAWLEQKGVLSIEQAVEFLLQASEAIADAHGLGIVHRDLKPANLFCIRRSDGVLSAKVLDFGISKVTGDLARSVSVTQTTSIIGSPLYMSPEQLRSSRDVDARTDIWSLGVILYQLLTGRTPFESDTMPDLFVKIVSAPTPRVRQYRPDVPGGLEQVILKCLEKERDARYSNIAELALALSPYAPKRARASVERIRGIIQATGLSASALAMPPSSDVASQSKTAQTDAAWGATAPPRMPSKKWLAIGVTGFFAALGLAVLGFTKHSQPETVRVEATSTPASIALAVATARSIGSASEGVPSASPVQPAPVVASVASAETSPSALASAVKTPVGESTTPVSKHAVLPSSTRKEARSAAAVGAPTRAATAAKVDCNPNYTIDSAGLKHFKKECFAK